MSTTLIEKDVGKDVVPEFTGKAADTLREYYKDVDVLDKSIAEKIAALGSSIGRFEFSAYGGQETEEMRLRAAERIFLFQKGIPI